MSVAATASLAATVLFVLLAVFQVGLALGAPWGRASWGGGQPDVLPPRLRGASGVSAVILVLAGLTVLTQAGVMGNSPPEVLRWVVWGLVGFLLLNTLGNFTSKSRYERWVMGPIALILAVLCAVVAWTP